MLLQPRWLLFNGLMNACTACAGNLSTGLLLFFSSPPSLSLSISLSLVVSSRPQSPDSRLSCRGGRLDLILGLLRRLAFSTTGKDEGILV